MILEARWPQPKSTSIIPLFPPSPKYCSVPGAKILVPMVVTSRMKNPRTPFFHHMHGGSPEPKKEDKKIVLASERSERMYIGRTVRAVTRVKYVYVEKGFWESISLRLWLLLFGDLPLGGRRRPMVALLLILFLARARAACEKPNVLVIQADDLGWADISA